jgi:hypothetical protein
VDLDGDGHMDILSGSWPGELYCFRGQGKGKYLAGEQIKDKGGKVIKLDSASTIFAVDYNGDGKLDLLIGSIGGHVYLMLNEGNGKANAFGPAQKLKVDGKEIMAAHGDSHPILADWDKDGKLDLLVASGAGSVLWYRNTGTKTEPKLAAPKTIVAEGNMRPEAGKEARWGSRAKICVTDWNGDGWPDLLLGDFGSVQADAPKLTDADKVEQRKAQEKYQAVVKEYLPLMEKSEALSKPVPGETPEAAKERQQKIKELREQMAKISPRLSEAAQALQRFQPRFEYLGNVWLFLRDPAANAKTKATAGS